MYWVSNGKINYNKLPKLPFSNFHLSSNTVRYGLERSFIIGCILWYFIVFVQMIYDLYEDKEWSQRQKNDNDFGLCIMLVIYTLWLKCLLVLFLNWF